MSINNNNATDVSDERIKPTLGGNYNTLQRLFHRSTHPDLDDLTSKDKSSQCKIFYDSSSEEKSSQCKNHHHLKKNHRLKNHQLMTLQLFQVTKRND